MAHTAALMDPITDVDNPITEIFTILQSEFLKLGSPLSEPPVCGKVRILSIDAGGAALLAAASLVRLESHLRDFNSSACISDFFDIVAGSGAGGLLAAMLFTRGMVGSPLFSAEEAFHFLAKKPKKGILRGLLRRTGGASDFRRLFGDATLRDTIKPLLVPCYDVDTGSPFMFSRADAVEADGYDFTVNDVCAATCSDGVVEVRSVDRRTRVLAVGGEAAMVNPTAAAITHVLNNKREFPMAAGVEDLLVLSFGGGDAGKVGEGSADMVDQLMSTVFGNDRTNNNLRVQARGLNYGKTAHFRDPAAAAAALLERNVESVMFEGRKIDEKTIGEKLEQFADELVSEHVQRVCWRACEGVWERLIVPTCERAWERLIVPTCKGAWERLNAPTMAIEPAITPPCEGACEKAKEFFYYTLIIVILFMMLCGDYISRLVGALAGVTRQFQSWAFGGKKK